MSIKTTQIHGTPERIKRLKDEHDWIGRHVTRVVNDTTLVIYALPPKKRKKKPIEGEEKRGRPVRQRRGNGYNRHKEIE